MDATSTRTASVAGAAGGNRQFGPFSSSGAPSAGAAHAITSAGSYAATVSCRPSSASPDEPLWEAEGVTIKGPLPGLEIQVKTCSRVD